METEQENSYIKGFEDSKILRPSAAYRQASESYPHRISELVFGSLLASYILGFVSIGASQLDPNKIGWSQVISGGFIYLPISCSFCFLTAALYSVYHHSILTMPNVPISDLTTDFLIAISQAVLFGVSIIAPRTFLVCLGILLLLVAWRQEVKFRALRRFFYERLKVEVHSTQKAEQSAREAGHQQQKSSRQLFRAQLEESNLTDGWGPLKGTHYLCAILALGGGTLFCYLAEQQPVTGTEADKLIGWKSWVNRLLGPYSWFCAIIYMVVGFVIFWQTRRVLQAKSVALDEQGEKIIKKMDVKASALAAKIKAG